MTPRVLNIYLDENEEKQRYETKESIYQAFLISRFVWQKKVDIEAMINKIDNPIKKEMTDEDMLQQVKILNKMFGGETKNRANTCNQ